MALPKQVAEAAEKAKQIHAEMMGNTEQPPAAPAPDTNPPPVSDPLKAPAPEQQGDDYATLQQRYNVLQGKYRAEVPRLAETVRTLETKIQELTQKLDQAATSQQKPDEALGPSQEEIDQFGPEFAAFVQKASRAELSRELLALTKRLDAIEHRAKNTEQAVQLSAEDRFLAQLAEAVPNWKTINSSPAWLQWLGEIDPLSGVPRQALLDNAHAAGDVVRVAGFFTTFLGGASGAQKPSGSQPTISPPAGRGGNPPPTAGGGEKKTYTRAEIKSFYDDKRRGLYAGREQEAMRIEQDIAAAANEGRVR